MATKKKTVKKSVKKVGRKKITKTVTTTVETVEEPIDLSKNITHIAILVDSSGSMGHLRSATLKNLDQQIRAIKDSARQSGQRTTVTLGTFNYNLHLDYMACDVAQAGGLTTYYTQGGTALFDAVTETVNRFKRLPDANEKTTSFLIIVLTDGEENSSSQINVNRFPELMRSLNATDRWTFAFSVPRGYKSNLERQYNIPAGNIQEWDQTEEGVTFAMNSNIGATHAYFSNRSIGLRATNNFYVTTDLSGVKSKDLKNLTDLQSNFKAWTVDKETDVKSFVEGHGKEFHLGSVYYMLTKKEKVQPRKQVLLVEKGKKAVYGGQEARDLLGLPPNQEAVVTPGNHANYDVYVQSASINRKLVRGTKVLFDTTMTKSLQPTWDHEAAKAAADAKKALSTNP